MESANNEGPLVCGDLSISPYTAITWPSGQQTSSGKGQIVGTVDP